MDVRNDSKLNVAADASDPSNISLVYADNSGAEAIKRKLSDDPEDSPENTEEKHRKKKKKVSLCVDPPIIHNSHPSLIYFIVE